MTAGYSGTPLAKKLGIGEGAVVAVLGAYDGFRSDLEPLPPGVRFVQEIGDDVDIVHIFTTDRSRLEVVIDAAASAIHPDGAIWVSWPKKAANVPTDMTEDVVREVALPLGLVDNKVCAVNDVWSGLRVVWRRERR